MKPFSLMLVLGCMAMSQGCAGIFVAGAATTAAVANDRRSVGSVIDDQNIEIKATNAIAARQDINKASRISATSMNGKVLLVGQTPYAQYSRDIEKQVARVDGVRYVYNELRIRKPIDLGQQATDSWITSKVKSQMLATKGIDSTRFKVVTENGEVFLMGLVTRDEADKAVNLTRKISGVRKVIKVFEYIQGNGKTGTTNNTSPTTSPDISSEPVSSGGGEVQIGAAPEEVIKY